MTLRHVLVCDDDRGRVARRTQEKQAADDRHRDKRNAEQHAPIHPPGSDQACPPLRGSARSHDLLLSANISPKKRLIAEHYKQRWLRYYSSAHNLSTIENILQ